MGARMSDIWFFPQIDMAPFEERTIDKQLQTELSQFLSGKLGAKLDKSGGLKAVSKDKSGVSMENEVITTSSNIN